MITKEQLAALIKAVEEEAAMTTTKSPKTKRSRSCGTQASTQKSHPFGNGLPGSGLKSAHSERACNPRTHAQKSWRPAGPRTRSGNTSQICEGPRSAIPHFLCAVLLRRVPTTRLVSGG